ncbi:MAG: Ig-like domain-containing protein, partial [Verrucomicrobiales bacterium]|nr:Ig-like domain-containing protein [Verrucomicrobiales bacterium]
MRIRALGWSGGFHAVVGLALLFASTWAPAAPSLSIETTLGRGIRLSWNQAEGAFAPEWTDSLRSPTTWNPIDGFQLLPGGGLSMEMPAATGTRFFRLRSAPLTTIKESSPAHGESGVAVTRETVLRFSQPLAAGTVITQDALHAEFGGYRLLSRAEFSSDRRTATLFFLENLPGNARVRVTLEVATLHDIFGRAIDGDGDGQPGGTRIVEFDTSSLASVPKTAVVGRVFASELVPGEAGAGDFNRPLAGVTITVDGLEETIRTTTDVQGNFKLTPVPAGRFFVHVDGRTAVGSEWPGGAYYPFVGKAWEAVAGREDNLAGGNGEIYLPRVPTDSLQPVSATADTSIAFPAAVLRRNPKLAGVTVTVPANALFSEN